MKLNFLTTSIIACGIAGLTACGGATTNTANKPAMNAANMTNMTNTANTSTNMANTAGTTANSTASAPAADGDVVKIDDAGIMMTVPKGFKFSKDGADTIVKTDDDGVDTRFTVLSDENLDKVFEDATKEIGEYVKGAKLSSEEPEKSTSNGLEISSWNGTGKATNGDNVQFQMAIVSIPGSTKKPVMALTYAEAESLASHKADLDKFFNSIKKQ